MKLRNKLEKTSKIKRKDIMTELNTANFGEETAQGVVIVDFYADWCRPCKTLSQSLSKITNAKICKINVDYNNDLAAQYRVSAIPKILFMKDGSVVEEVVGVLPLDKIQEKVDALNANS
jgi:thioredoxin 1